METTQEKYWHQKLDEKLEPYARVLVQGEEFLYFGPCANLRPSSDVVAVTNLRVLGIEDGKIKFEARWADLRTFAAEAGEGRELARWKGRVEVVRGDGASMKFVVPNGDVSTISRCYEMATAATPDSAAAAALESVAPVLTAGKYESRSAAWEAQKETWKARSANARTEHEAEKADEEERSQHDPEVHGDLVEQGEFGAGLGGGNVRLYSRGFVRVGSGTAPFEKLLSIKYTEQIGQDKSAGGRALARFATGGLSSLASNERRDLFLTIATDRQVYTLRSKGLNARLDATLGRRLEAAGEVLIDANRMNPVGQATVVNQVAPEANAADKLKQIAELHRDGVLSDDEFAAAKAKLLEQL